MAKKQGHRQSVYFSEEEWPIVEKAAKKAGMEPGTYLKQAILFVALRGETPRIKTTLTVE